MSVQNAKVEAFKASCQAMLESLITTHGFGALYNRYVSEQGYEGAKEFHPVMQARAEAAIAESDTKWVFVSACCKPFGVTLYNPDFNVRMQFQMSYSKTGIKKVPGGAPVPVAKVEQPKAVEAAKPAHVVDAMASADHIQQLLGASFMRGQFKGQLDSIYKTFVAGTNTAKVAAFRKACKSGLITVPSDLTAAQTKKMTELEAL